MSRPAPVSVVETPEFLAAAPRIMDEDERGLLVDCLARNPLAGDIIPGTGGVRKLRWALEGRGERGGARVIHYHHSDAMPIFVLTAYAKNERADLSQAERNDFRRLTALLAERYVRRTRR
jgi:RelE toxin of RelE / RelB toxin-antitoxin system